MVVEFGDTGIGLAKFELLRMQRLPLPLRTLCPPLSARRRIDFAPSANDRYESRGRIEAERKLRYQSRIGAARGFLDDRFDGRCVD